MPSPTRIVPPGAGAATRRAVRAASAVARGEGLRCEDAVVLQESNRVTLRLLPGDVVARVAPAEHQAAAFELDLARQLVAVGAPVAGPEPRVQAQVHRRDGLTVTLWTHHEPTGRTATGPELASALHRLHTGLRAVHVVAPPWTDRVDEALTLLAEPSRSPGPTPAERELLVRVLTEGRADLPGPGSTAAGQLLHGEPHPGNVLTTAVGPLFIDLETCSRGPVELDLAHLDEEVAEHYPDPDRALLHRCRVLTLAVATSWRFDPADRLPDGSRLAREWLARLRTLARPRWRTVPPDPAVPGPGAG